MNLQLIEQYVAGRLGEEESCAFEEYCLANPEFARQAEYEQRLKAGLAIVARGSTAEFVRSDSHQARWNFAAAAFKPFAAHSGPTAAPSAALVGGKSSPADASGDFSYSFIKNYSRDFAISRRALKVFRNAKGKKKKK